MVKKSTYEELKQRVKDLENEALGYKRAEEALQESEQRLSQMVQGSAVATFVIDGNHTIIQWNKACESLTGFSAKQMIGTRNHRLAFYSEERPVMVDLIVDNVPEEDIGRCYSGKYRRSSVTEGAYEAEDFFPHLGEGGKWLFFTAASLIDLEGKIIGAIETLQDTTERKRAEEALVQSETKYRTLAEQLPAITYIAALDESSTTLYVSPRIEEILGISPAEYKANPDFWVKHLHPDDRERVIDEVRRCHESGQPFISEYRMISKGGRLVWISDDSVTVRDDRGNPFYLQGVMCDITERKQAENALQKSEEKYRNIFNNAQVGLYRSRFSDGKMLIVNNRMAEMFGYESTEEAVANYVASEHYVDPGTREKLLGILREYGKFTNFEARFTRSDGSIIWIQYSGILFPEKGYFEGVATDITERERVEEELQKRMNELETFYRATLGREERVIELKQEVNELLEQLGKNKKYRDNS